MELCEPAAGTGGLAELQRIKVLEDRGQLSADEARRLRELAEVDVVIRVSDTRWDCLACGAVGSQPGHRLDCPLYRAPQC